MAAASAELLAEVAAKASTLGDPGASVASAKPATSTSAITFPVTSVAVIPAKEHPRAQAPLRNVGASQEDFDKGVQRAVSALLDIR